MSPPVSYCFLYRNIIDAGVYHHRPCSTVKIVSKGAMGKLTFGMPKYASSKGPIYLDCPHMLFDLLTTGLEIKSIYFIEGNSN